jgi:dephospho-CoA kinase
MKVIGITGGVGAGKSLVLSLLKEMTNCDIIMADDVAKSMYQKGFKAYDELVEFFGETILNEDHSKIDLEKLSKLIYKEPNKRMLVNSIVHPLTKELIIERITKHKIAEDVDYCFVEAALLLEDHYDNFCDEVWYIHASKETRRERLKSTRGYSDEKIDAIFNAQLSEEEFKSKSQHVINNEESIDLVKGKLATLLNL